MFCGELTHGDCISTDPNNECGDGIRNMSRSCTDGTLEKCIDSCGNYTETCTISTCVSTTPITTPTGMFDSFHQMCLLIACIFKNHVQNSNFSY